MHTVKNPNGVLGAVLKPPMFLDVDFLISCLSGVGVFVMEYLM